MKIWIDVLGCPKNEADSSVVEALLIERGHEIVDSPELADAAIINTCGFITASKEESVNEIFGAVAEKESKPLKIVAHGCLVQRYFKELREGIPEVDSFLGVVSPERIAKALEEPEDFVGVPEPVYGFLGRVTDEAPHAYVKVGDGCNRRCAFCAIPSIKGPLRNRKPEDVLKEISALVKSGKKEIILVSQDLTEYSEEGTGFVDLLRRIEALEGDFAVRLLYLYPDGITDELIDFVASSKRVLHYFDIPVQHASPRLLGAMRRNPDVGAVKEKILRTREKIEDAVFRTTVITGFPSETDHDFDLLLNFVKEIGFDRLGAFVYSDEEGTESRSIEPKVPETVARKRYNRLMEVQKRISLEKNEKLLGRIFDVLVEEVSGDGFVGRTYMDAPEIDGAFYFVSEKPIEPGETVKVKVTSYEFYDLEGVVV